MAGKVHSPLAFLPLWYSFFSTLSQRDLFLFFSCAVLAGGGGSSGDPGQPASSGMRGLLAAALSGSQAGGNLPPELQDLSSAEAASIIDLLEEEASGLVSHCGKFGHGLSV